MNFNSNIFALIHVGISLYSHSWFFNKIQSSALRKEPCSVPRLYFTLMFWNINFFVRYGNFGILIPTYLSWCMLFFILESWLFKNIQSFAWKKENLRNLLYAKTLFGINFFERYFTFVTIMEFPTLFPLMVYNWCLLERCWVTYFRVLGYSRTFNLLLQINVNLQFCKLKFYRVIINPTRLWISAGWSLIS